MKYCKNNYRWHVSKFAEIRGQGIKDNEEYQICGIYRFALRPYI